MDYREAGEAGISPYLINAVKMLYTNSEAVVRVGNEMSNPFYVTKGLRQGCCLSPTLFNIYIEHALKKWKRKVFGMGLKIGDESLYTLQFADDQVVVASDQDDAAYMTRKLREEYEAAGLYMNLDKTKYLSIGAPFGNLDIGSEQIIACREYTYLGIIFNDEGTSKKDISTKVNKARHAIRCLNPILWNDKITKNTKKRIYSAIIEPICTYGSEIWELNQRSRSQVSALEMDFLRRSLGISRLERVTNVEIKRQMGVTTSITSSIQNKQLSWFGHVCRMNNERWPKKMLDWVPEERRRPGRPRRSWRNEIDQAMETRGLEQDDCHNRTMWREGIGMRRQP